MLVVLLIWDPWNVAHNARHEVTPDEVEEVCHDDPMTSATYEGRLRVIGQTLAGRMLTVILAPRNGDGTYYTVTARSASRKERRFYSESQGGNG